MTHSARTFRGEPTVAEAAFWELVRDRGLDVKFRRQHELCGFVVDFYCVSANLVVEIDGGVHDENVDADEARSNKLDAAGVRVMRFRNEEVVAEPLRVARLVGKAIEAAEAADALESASTSSARESSSASSPLHSESASASGPRPAKWPGEGRVRSAGARLALFFMAAEDPMLAPLEAVRLDETSPQIASHLEARAFKREPLVVDFANIDVDVATQSWVHALLFEVLRVAWAKRTPIYVVNAKPAVRSSLELVENYALAG